MMPSESALPILAAPTPRTLWVELTSKCPFDCVFCSRQLRRGAGQHLPIELFRTLIDSLVDPRKILLNYSGESSVYPDLIPAIQYAHAAGAVTELVSAMATFPPAMLEPLCRSGLNRLTVSLHATDPDLFAAIYRYSGFATLRDRLTSFMNLRRGLPDPPAVDLAFVAMEANLPQLSPVAAFAQDLGLEDIMIFPVIRRDPIPAEFPVELTTSGDHRPDFRKRVRKTVEEAETDHPQVRFTICNGTFNGAAGQVGEVPSPYGGELPPGAWIHSCEQNPWDTAHVLSNGDVVACEVLDRIPLGNLTTQTLDEIWHGALYQEFRERYRRGEVPECRTCPWKRAYRPHTASAEIVASRGMSAQLLHGWHEASGEGHIWASQQAAAFLSPRPGAQTLHVSGLLPRGPNGQPNRLTISVNGTQVGAVTNPWEETLPFGLDFPVAGSQNAWTIEFRTSHVYRPVSRGEGADQRDLGFALVLATAKSIAEPEAVRTRNSAMEPLVRSIQRLDTWGRRVRYRWHRTKPAEAAWKPGLSVVIPEWDNAAELAECLAGVHAAAEEWTEPLEIIVVVNGSPESNYRNLRQRYSEVIWRFHPDPLGFAGAVRVGVREARYDWVYLLNSDAVPGRATLQTLAPLRSAGVFSIGSQIFFKDATRYRDETNWTCLLVEAGLATIHDWIPQSGAPAPSFYSGGGASLFRKKLILPLLRTTAYDPFYWEDVEWGWRARKMGYSSVFCPESKVLHTRRGTIGRHYSAAQIEEITQRNRLLYQLRNFTDAGSLSRAVEQIAHSADLTEYFLSPRVRRSIASGRLWNHLAALTDEEVFTNWQNSLNTAHHATAP